MKSLSSFLDIPAVRELEEFYGVGLQKLHPSTRMLMIAGLSTAAHNVVASKVSQSLDDICGQILSDFLDDIFVQLFSDRNEAPPAHLWELLRRLDQQMTDPHQAIALVAGIAEGLAYASV